MLKRSYERFVTSGTRLRDKFFADPFRSARFKTASVYLLIGAGLLLATDFFIDNKIREILYEVARQSDIDPIGPAFAHIRQILWITRISRLLVYAIALYFITGFAFRHIRRVAELQRRFIATASHELRTPLTVMKNAKEVALRHPETLTREKAIELMQKNLIEVNRLSETVEFLLAFSSFESGQRTPVLEPVDLARIVQETTHLLRESSLMAHAYLEVEAPASLFVRGNATGLRQVVLNLVKNALTYSSAGGTVRVQLVCAGRDAILTVYDTGIGIPKADMPHIFEPFFRGNLADGHATSAGIGLGLAIVREVLRFHHASINVESALGRGTTFTLRFRVLARD